MIPGAGGRAMHLSLPNAFHVIGLFDPGVSVCTSLSYDGVSMQVEQERDGF